MVSKKKVAEVSAYHKVNGKKKTLSFYGITSDTLTRYLRRARKQGEPDSRSSDVLSKIKEKYTDKELTAIAAGGRLVPGMAKVPIISFEGKRIRFCLTGDWHLGSMFSDTDRIYQLYEEIEKEGCEFVANGGDITEGMSNRPGHIYELSHLGYEEQKKHAVDVIKDCPVPMFGISGNHDRWFIKSSGANILGDIENELGKDKFTFLGHDEGDISLKGHAILKLWHGEDGNTYAISYRVQKIVEALTGGEKPDILSCHHVHKFNYIFTRHIHAISAGCMESQSKWMRSKRIEAHTGFVIVDATVNKDGVAKVNLTWYPFYT